MLKGTTLKDSDWGGIKLKDVSWINSAVHWNRHVVCVKIAIFGLVTLGRYLKMEAADSSQNAYLPN
jgi:hypothetical protein